MPGQCERSTRCSASVLSAARRPGRGAAPLGGLLAAALAAAPSGIVGLEAGGGGQLRLCRQPRDKIRAGMVDQGTPREGGSTGKYGWLLAVAVKAALMLCSPHPIVHNCETNWGLLLLATACSKRTHPPGLSWAMRPLPMALLAWVA